MKQIRIFILFGTLAVFLYFVNSGIITAENNINNGTVAYFELAPVDPQSILQGFYMELRYDVENDARDVVNDSGRDRGQLVLSLDDNNVAHFERRYVDGEILAEDEVLVNFYARDTWWQRVRVGVDSFLFQEGHADDFARARYAEVRILDDGGVMLVNLADENLQTIIPADD